MSLYTDFRYYLFKTRTLNSLFFYFGVRSLGEFGVYYANAESNIIAEWIKNQFSNNETGELFSAIFKLLLVSGEWQVGVGSFIILLIVAFLKWSEIISEKRIHKKNKKVISEVVQQSFNQVDVPLNSRYKSRDSEEHLIKQLDAEIDVLLLTGISFCGKSELAKNIAKKFTEKGFIYFHTYSSTDAERWLNIQSEKRICLLEDPFGHTLGNENPDDWQKFKKLLNNILPGRKLIVTTRSEKLISIFNDSNESKWNIGNHNWVNLTITDRKFLLELWSEFSKNLDSSTIKKITSYLQESSINEILQVGHLHHLANVPKTILRGKTIDELSHLARVDSEELGRQIKSKGKKWGDIYSVLGLCVGALENIEFKDLKFIIKQHQTPKSLEKDVGIFQYSTNTDEFSFPKYKDEELADLSQYSECLQYFKDRGYLNSLEDGITFSHPHYKEAANYLVLNQDLQFNSFLLSSISNCLTCLNQEAAFHCAKLIPIIYGKCGIDSKEKINKILYNVATQSIFPKVKDRCLTILMTNFSDLDERVQNSILHKVGIPFEMSNFLWHKGSPYLNSKHSNFRDYFVEYDETEMDELLNKIESGYKVSVKELWESINYVVSKKYSPKATLLNKAINSDEVVLRSTMAGYYFRNLTSFDHINLVDKILNDEHPSVIFSGIRGAFLGFPTYNDLIKDLVLPKLKKAIGNKWVVIRGNDMITKFGINEYHDLIDWKSCSESDKKDMWELWAILVPSFFKYFPLKANIPNSGRFGLTLEKAAKYLSSKNGLNVSKSIFSWISDRIKFRWLDDYELSFITFVIDSTNDNPSIRFELFVSILDTNDTGLATTSISWVISKWDDLTSKEKTYLLEYLKSERQDIRWIKSVAVTGYSVPSDIQNAIFDSTNFLDNSPKKIVAEIDKPLLLDVLNIYCRHPSPLNIMGFGCNEIWDEVCKYILSENLPYNYKLCLRQILNRGANGFGPLWNDGQKIWALVCKKNKDKDLLVTEFIRMTIECNCNIQGAKLMWNELIQELYALNKIEILIKHVLANIELLQYDRNSEEDFYTFFNQHDFLINEIIPNLPHHNKLYSILKIIERENKLNTELKNELIQELNTISQDCELRLKFIVNFAEKVASTKELHEDIKIPIHRIIENKSLKLTQDKSEIGFKFYEDYKIQNWQGLNKEFENK